MFKSNRRHIKETKVYTNGGNITVNVASSFDIGDALREMVAETLVAAKEELYETYSDTDDEELQSVID
jgi:hypothetical protein